MRKKKQNEKPTQKTLLRYCTVDHLGGCGSYVLLLGGIMNLQQMTNERDMWKAIAIMTFTEVRTDPLTGVNNRRGLDDSLGSQLALVTRYHSVFSLVLFDIDHFKQINDQEGHLNGDRVIQELAQLLDESIRETDIIARYGGDEFVIIMPQTDLDGASIFAERLRAGVAERMTITVSGGVTAARESDDPESLIARADTALYNAKTAGRNRVFSLKG